MNKEELRDHFVRARDLEAAIYTQRELMERHQAYLHSIKPIPPEMAVPEPLGAEPIAPREPNKGILLLGWMVGALYFVWGLALLIDKSTSNDILATMPLLMGVGWYIFYYKLNARCKENIEAVRRKHEQEALAYERKKQAYEREVAQAEATFEKEKAAYEVRLAEHHAVCAASREKHDQMLEMLTDTLEEHYARNVIFPKYRNFVAVTTICEYLESGRCSTLEGADGAYNLYEMELRQNIIIGRLTAILRNLEQIQDNQYFLYQELRQANKTVNAIMREIKDVHETTRLSAWFAGVTALAETAPK